MMGSLQAEIDQETPPLYIGCSNLCSMTCSWPMCILQKTVHLSSEVAPFGSGIWFHIGQEPLD